MIQIPPYFRELARDTELVGRDPQVWVIAIEVLDFLEYRELPLDRVAREFVPPVSKASIQRSIARLVDRGYLELDADHGSHGRARYRLPLARIYPRPVAMSELLICNSPCAND